MGGKVSSDLARSATKVEDGLGSGDSLGCRIEDLAIHREIQKVIGKCFCIVFCGDLISGTYRRRIEGFHGGKVWFPPIMTGNMFR